VKENEPNRSFFPADESPVPLPPVAEAWADMRKKLDEEMPERGLFFFTRKGAGILLTLLLLSLGMFWFIERRGSRVRRNAPATETIRHAKQGEQGAGAGKLQGKKESERQGGGGEETGRHGTGRQEAGRQEASRQDEVTSRLEKDSATVQTKPLFGQGFDSPQLHRDTKKAGSQNNKKVAIGDEMAGTTGKRTVSGRSGGKVRISDAKRSVVNANLPRIGLPDPIRVWVTVSRRAQGVKEKIAGTEKKNPPAPEKSKRPRGKDSTRILWAAGLQDSKSFPVGAQQALPFNANLKKDLWFDYVPTPYFQYYVSRKLGFQAALQFNSPQYTESVSIYKAPDSGPPGLYARDTVVVVKKLYYFNVPLTVYYSPFRNFFLGAGIQFSNLRNGVAFQNNVSHYTGTGTGQPDSVLGSKVVALKDNRPAYNNLRKTEWRALFETDYYWKRLTLGLQYQQALGQYLYKPVDGSTGSDRNSSFNLYLRYNLLERRIRIIKR
jgi:hypothetical protein